MGARTDSSGRASASRPRSAAHRVVVLTARPATVADSRDSNLESCCGSDNERLSSRPWRFFCSKTAHSFGLGPLQTIKTIIIPGHSAVPVAWLQQKYTVAGRRPLRAPTRVNCSCLPPTPHRHGGSSAQLWGRFGWSAAWRRRLVPFLQVQLTQAEVFDRGWCADERKARGPVMTRTSPP